MKLLIKFLNIIDNDEPKPPTMLPATRAELLDRYRPDLARLEQLTGIDVLGVQARDDAAEESPTPTASA